jgi:predicted nucleic acid-binding protein
LSGVFLDASALVPIIVVRDQWHQRVSTIIRGLRRGRALALRTSNWTLYEALAIADRRSPGSASWLFGFVGREVRIDRVEADIELEALTRFLSWTDKSASVVDHANVLLAAAAGCDTVISFDVDFIPVVAGTGLRLLR